MEKHQNELHPEVAKEYDLVEKAPTRFMSSALNREINLCEMKLPAIQNIEDYLLKKNYLRKKGKEIISKSSTNK